MRITPALTLLGCALLGPGCSGGSEPLGTEPAPPDVARTDTSGLVGVQCYWGQTGLGRLPLSRIVHELRATEAGGVVDVSIVFNREFVDNTYGAGAIGWERGHKLRDLVGSDHVVLALRDKADQLAVEPKLDFISADPAMASGYRTLGVTGGDGKLLIGEAADVLESGSSLDDNFNLRGYRLEIDSPATDAAYTPNAQYPDWDFFVEYRVKVRASAFAGGFGGVTMDAVHASPSKLGTNTVPVEEGPCPTGAPDEPNPFPACARARLDAECVDLPATGTTPSDDPVNGT